MAANFDANKLESWRRHLVDYESKLDRTVVQYGKEHPATIDDVIRRRGIDNDKAEIK